MDIKGTTIIGVEKDGKFVIAGDGQVTMGESVVMKAHARKVRRIYNDKVVIYRSKPNIFIFHTIYTSLVPKNIMFRFIFRTTFQAGKSLCLFHGRFSHTTSALTAFALICL